MQIFISHATEDAEWAQKLRRALKRSGFKAWDSSEVSPGDNWALQIGRALEQAEAMVVLLSPAAARSENVKWEIDHALTTKRFKDRLIPVMIRPTTRFPWILSEMGVEQGEPGDVARRIASRLRAAAAA